ncbi:sucrose-phosphate synthase [Halothiobacillus diazotrophicus]|uniref:sucrose-phosphate synthase n=1 Tax=Halothiobacillus diazotrophicus TaxID=1860122 RepID=A0A191ZIJ2_9GAMM|nr:HAD family hydrolase [Halothiobacillus diazotrophicus]ANJ67721.1 sucrose-phosphate synthase [Halothiobacillus diazotrophicus]
MNGEPLYIVLISVHGLIRGHDLELGRDADTGGQTLYVVELARALARDKRVGRVDLITRRIVDPRVSSDYAEPEEDIGDGARIVRISAGPDEYLPKEQLWEYLNCLVDGALDHIQATGLAPALVHSHYADAGYVGVRLAHHLGVPLVFTGHSLGRVKRQRLLAKGESATTIEEKYNLSRRIRTEEETLAASALIVTSTQHEIEEQYGLYDWADEARMRVIAPGVNLARFSPPSDQSPPPIANELNRFLRTPDKPFVLALSRPDERKNLGTLVRAYGENAALRDQANLVIVAGNRDDIRDMDPGSRQVLTELLLLIDRYDLYGQCAYPRHHDADDVPDLYRYVTQTGGVFINPALTEPFGLTLIEAAACGAPIIATEDGGPQDIIKACANGELINPLDADEIGERLLALLKDKARWQTYSRNGINGVRQHYAWSNHVNAYLEAIEPLLNESPLPAPTMQARPELILVDRMLLVELSALGQNPDDPDLRELMAELRQRRRQVAFGIASDRPRHEVLGQLKRLKLPPPDVLVTRGGTQIHYGARLSRDRGWSQHISQNWQPDRIFNLLEETPGIRLGPRSVQGIFAIHALIDDHEAFIGQTALETRFFESDIGARIQRINPAELLITPQRASKGFALRYLAHQWNIPLDHILVAGGVLTDEDMLRGHTLGAVVVPDGKIHLPGLIDLERVMFSKDTYAAGIRQAMRHYDFFGACTLPEPQATDAATNQSPERDIHG